MSSTSLVATVQTFRSIFLSEIGKLLVSVRQVTQAPGFHADFAARPGKGAGAADNIEQAAGGPPAGQADKGRLAGHHVHCGDVVQGEGQPVEVGKGDLPHGVHLGSDDGTRLL